MPDFVCKLLKALYGLLQAPRQWFAKIIASLFDLGFQICSYDPCFYVQRTNKNVLIIKLFVHYLLISGSSLNAVQLLKSQLSIQFEMEACGETKLCLGLEISCKRQTNALKLS